MMLHNTHRTVIRSLLQRLQPIVTTYSRNSSRKEYLRKLVLSGQSTLTSNNIQAITHDFCGDKFFSTQIYILPDNAARNVLRTSDKYTEYLSVPLLKTPSLTSTSIESARNLIDSNWESLSPSEIIYNFEKISYYGYEHKENLNDEKYQGMAKAIEDNCAEFSDEELRQVLRYLQLWMQTSFKGDTFIRIWKCVDQQFVKRIPNLSISETFLIIDIYYSLTLCRKANFPWQSLKKISTKTRKLKTYNIVPFMFFYNASPKLPVNMYEIEYQLEQNLDKYSINEVGIIAKGFSKAQVTIKSYDLLIRLMQKTINEIDVIFDYSLIGISKILRLSNDERARATFHAFLERLTPEMHRFSLNAIGNIGHMMGRLLVCNHDLINNIVKRFEGDLQSAVINDLERIVFTLTSFNYDPKTTPLYDQIIKELNDTHREEEINEHRIAFCAILRYLTYVNLYPVELITKALASSYVDKKGNDNSYSIPRDYFILDQSVEIELPDYKGPRLNEKCLKRLARAYTTNGSKKKHGHLWFNSEMINDVFATCKEIIEPISAVQSVMILPHYHKNDLVIRMDQDNNFKDIGDSFPETPIASIKRIPQDSNDKWIVLLMGTFSHLTRDTHEKVGLITTNIRQLQRLGYTPVIIPHNEWRQLMTPESKIDYIKNILYK